MVTDMHQAVSPCWPKVKTSNFLYDRTTSMFSITKRTFGGGDTWHGHVVTESRMAGYAATRALPVIPS